MFLPPVMGEVSFLIADFLQVDYAQVVIAAIIPALLYFFAVFVMVDLKAAQIGKVAKVELDGPNVKEVIKEKGHLLLPLVVLIFLLLVIQWSPPLAAFWSIVSIPITSYLRKKTRMKIIDISEALQQGVKLSLLVAAATACAGIVIGVINMTGMGMGLPPVASYIVLAILAAPAMTNLGVPPIAAHLFIFYYGTLSAITPPIAFAAYAASGISGASPMKTGFVAVRLASVAFIVPFMFVFGPSLIMQGTVISIVVASITAFLGVYALAVALEGYLKQHLKVISRVILIIGSIMLLNVGVLTDIAGVILIGLILLLEMKREVNMEKDLKVEIQ